MKQRRGFTLIEMLVAIGIIAVLLAILIPAITGVRRQAKQTECASNIRQLLTAYNSYRTNERQGQSFAYSSTNSNTEWFNVLKQYANQATSRYCPETKNIAAAQGDAVSQWTFNGVNGSFGFNGWLYEPFANAPTLPGGMTQAGFFQKPLAVSDASAVPVFADCIWKDGFPLEADTPPIPPANTDTGAYSAGTTNHMQRFCIARHTNNTINVGFLDGHVATFKLVELWTLNWHNGWVQPNPLPKLP